MIQPPTLCLPPIAKIATFTTAQLFESLQYLHSLYRPQVRGSRRRRGEDEDDDRPDAFERAYAIRWLTALIAQLEARAIQFPSEPNPPIDDTDSLIQQAAALLATCAGVAAAGKVQRRFTFESTLAGKMCIDLTDIPLDNHDYGSVGAQTWGGACVLAEMIVEHPGRFGLGTRWSSSTGSDDLLTRTRERPLRILELGAGTGLVGLTVAKLLQAWKIPKPDPTPHHRATIVLTDLHPAVLDNLQSNIDANFPTVSDDTHNAILVNSHPLDWSSFSMTDTTPNILSTPFDVVFGADIVYEAQHTVWIRDCLKFLLSNTDGPNEDPVFHLVIPLRPTHTFESSTIEAVFGSKDRVLEGSQRELTVLSKESIFCEAYGDGMVERRRTDDDVEYVYYRVGWTQ
ncbi:putative methyltransferase-domain-containing protein [Boletus coccyginus]|nr:putative methyltransferase-domain-containing protein [Boletus coccyginus]